MATLTGSRCITGILALGALMAHPAVVSATTIASSPAQPLFAASGKSAAILGGMSQLELIAAQQQGGLAARQVTEIQTAMMVPASRPALASSSPELRPESPQLNFATPSLPVSATQPDIFGSVALGVSRTPLDSQWRRASVSHFNEKGSWTPLLASARQMSRTEQLEKVNSWVNSRIQFVEDRDEYRKGDYWANGADSLRRGRGDCEDYALAKMQLLRALGFSSNDIYLSIVKDLVRRADHAVLIVRSEGRFFVLDNNTDRLVDAGSNQDYRPVFTYSATQSWTHGYARPTYADNAGGSLRAARR